MIRKTFTLIEMLIVVVIIGILAAALIPRLQSVQARARDTKRKADLHQIATALEIYKEDNHDFSQYTDIDIGDGLWMVSHLGSGLERYMTTVPADSDNSIWLPWGGTPATGYVFGPISRRGTAYSAFILGARTESDGSSSNWVTNTMLGDECPSRDCSLVKDTNRRCGSIMGHEDRHAEEYEKNICNTVIFSSKGNDECIGGGNGSEECITYNDGSGNCWADKNSASPGGDLRYIYVN